MPELYKQPGSDAWYVDIKVPGVPRVRRSTRTNDRVAAQKIRDQLKAELWNARPAPINGPSWSKAVDAWLDAETRSDSELLSLAKLGRLYPDRPLSACTPESFTKALSFCKTAGTFTRYRTMIAAILNLAGHKVKLDTRKDKKKKRRDWITREQWVKLYEQLPAHMKPMAEFAIETGLRQANVLGLKWAQVDLKRKFMWLEADEVKDDDALPVPLSKVAVKVLQAQLAARVEDCAWVFTYRGKPIAEIKTAFIAACIRAGLGQVDPDGCYQGFTWHGLRHTWATWHVQNGTPLDVLQKLGGWSDLRMVMNYSHHSPGHLAQFADANEVKKRGAKK
jgi:integrase